MISVQTKAIETIYDGYRFRSRLEARWAVFFKALNIYYEYEKEGFDLDNAGLYLPDFYIPETNTWIEIKPFGYPDWQARLKCKEFAAQISPIVLFDGDPMKLMIDNNTFVYWWAKIDIDGDVEIRHVAGMCFSFFLSEELREFWTWANTWLSESGVKTSEEEKKFISVLEKLKNACLESRQARFDHRS
jgi:hypothetical protein